MKRYAIAIVMLLFGQACAVAAPTRPDFAYCRPHQGHWQIWRFSLAAKEHTMLTDTPWDKRGTRFLPENERLLFRDNQGKLFEIGIDGGNMRQVALPATEVVKDFDYSPAYGFLVSSYAANAMDNIRIWLISADLSDKRLLVSEPHINELPRWIPGTKDFVFVKSHAGTSAIHQANVVTGEHTPLLPTHIRATDPTPSPDGKWLACCVEGDTGFDLSLVDMDTREIKSLYAGPGLEADPCWSPGGEALFFTTWDGENLRIAAIDLGGTGFRYVSPKGVDARFPACLSPIEGGVE